MTEILVFIAGSLVGFLVAWVWFSSKIKEVKREAGRVEKEIQREREIWYGFSEFNEKATKMKEERKQKIMDELKKGGILQTSKIADMLDISRATAFRYMEELEKEGLAGQIGNTGRDVKYKIK